MAHKTLTFLTALLPGLLLTGALAALAAWVSSIDFIASHGISMLTVAIVAGLILGNVFPKITQGRFASGVGFSKQRLLRLGIILYGLRLTLQDIMRVGLSGVLIDAIMLTSTFLLSVYLGVRYLRMDRDTAMLVGSGSAICGAAAVLATEPLLRASVDKVAVAVATVVVFGTLGMFLYPFMYAIAGHAVGMSHLQYGIYTGSTVHEVAQVVAAARTVSAQAADAAVVTKMVRVMLLAPFLLLLSIWIARYGSRSKDAQNNKAAVGAKQAIMIPWFAVGFVIVTLLHSFIAIPTQWVESLHWVNVFDTVILSMAMAALGLGTHVSAIRKAGLKPLSLATLLFFWLVIGGFAVNRLLG